MLDTLALRLITMLFALLLITAGANKLNDMRRFRAVLENYRIIPTQIVGVFALLLPCVEILIGLGWIFAWRIDLVSVFTAALLAVYAFAIALNLFRGRTYIDCGCGFSSTKTLGVNSEIQQLSIWLVYRNILFIVLALLASSETKLRAFVMLDYFSIIAATIVLVFAYGAFNQLLVNHNAIDSWRKPLLQRINAAHNHAQDQS